MPAFTKQKTGRPPSLTRVLRLDDDGNPVRIMDAIVDAVRAGAFVEEAAASVGVGKHVLYDAQRTGARVEQALTAGARRADFTTKELACAEFSRAVGMAYAAATVEDVQSTDRLARGGLLLKSVTTRTEQTAEGQPRTVTTVKQTHTPPDGAMLRWRLGKRNESTWGRERLELTGAEGGPIELTVSEKRARVLEGLEVLAGKLTEPEPAATPEELSA